MGKLKNLAFMACLACAAPALAQEKFILGIDVESKDFPDLNTKKVILGKSGEAFEFDGLLFLTSEGLTGTDGPQGWSISVRNEVIEILGTTFAGTVADDKANGGLFDAGFRVFDVIDPTKKGNDGKTGMVSAVVLSLVGGTTLPANTKQIIGKNRYKATIGSAEAKGSIRYEDNLIGKGQKVPNTISYTKAVPLTKGETILTLQVEGPVAEVCNDGKDNDGDSKVDCADPDCATDAACKEDCDDKVDNDLDGKTDCADPDCAGQAACKEDCDDKVDNDADGKTDCADDDCKADPGCKVVEDCDDKVDNDGDTKVDCDDTDCAADPACKVVGDKGFDLILSAAGSKREGVKNVVDVEAKAGVMVIAIASVAPTKAAEAVGIQGWSISVTHDKDHLSIQNGDGFPTISGTDAGRLFKNGFEKTEVVDPARNNGKEGFVSAIVLALTENITLDPTKDQSIARSKYTLKAGTTKADFPIPIMYMSGLRGQGQPVPNVLTGAPLNRFIDLELRAADIIPPGEKRFRRGDANDDGKVNIADPIWIINELVRSGPPTACKSAADANDDGLVDLSDAMYLIQWRFLAGPTPRPPFPACGLDPTQDNLPCPEGAASTCPAP